MTKQMNKVTDFSVSFLLALLITLPYSIEKSIYVVAVNVLLAFLGTLMHYSGLKPLSNRKDLSLAVGVVVAITTASLSYGFIPI
jgi:hypothetical protein